MKYSGKKAEGFLQKPDPACWAVLVFSEDEGVANDGARSILAAWGDLELITLDDDAIKREPALLFDALEAQSLLGDDRAIRVRTNGDKIAALLIEAVSTADQNPGRFAARLVVSAGGLQKRSKLRAGFEAANGAAALQLFEDDAGNIAELVRSALGDVGAKTEPGVIEAFTGDLPGHRGLARQEIEKLSLYAHNLGRPVSIDDIHKLNATDIDQALGFAVISALDGRAKQAMQMLDRVLITGASPITVLRAIQRESQRLLQAHEIGGLQGNVGMKLRPPVWQSDWPAFSARLRNWPPKRIARIIERVYEAEQQVKTAGPTGAPVLRTLMKDIARVAAGPKAA